MHAGPERRRPLRRLARVVVAGVLALAFSGCTSSDGGASSGSTGVVPPAPAAWSVVREGLPGALLSVWGTSATDVWTVGADARDGSGPLVWHYDGAKWERVATGETKGDLWWVHGFAGGPIFMGGAGGVILRYEGGKFTKMTTPGTETVFGLWGESPASMWAVGGTLDTKGFAWRLQGDQWTPEPSLPAAVVADAGLWKVHGRSASDVWLVGSRGIAFHWNGTVLEQQQTGVGVSIFTAHSSQGRFAAVGGTASGFVLENDGTGWKKATDATYGLTGIALGAGDTGYAVGSYGSVYVRDEKGWREEDTKLNIQLDLHGVWIDPSGGVWSVGGRTASFPLTSGFLLHKGDPVKSGGF